MCVGSRVKGSRIVNHFKFRNILLNVCRKISDAILLFVRTQTRRKNRRSLHSQIVTHHLVSILLFALRVTRLGDLLDFGQLFKAFGNFYRHLAIFFWSHCLRYSGISINFKNVFFRGRYGLRLALLHHKVCAS